MKKISPSAIITFNECPHKYKLIYVDKRPSKETIAFAFGKAAHEAIQNSFIKRNSKLAKEQFFDLFKSYFEASKEKIPEKEWSTFDELIQDGHNIFDKFEESVAKSFDLVEEITCEEEIIEPLTIGNDWHFKGKLDLSFKLKTKYHIIDIKTSKSGWKPDKLQNTSIISQPILYKYFWAKKKNIDLNKVLTSFLILKKKSKYEPVQSLKVSSGPKTTERCLNLMNHFANLIDKGFFLKSFDKNVCRWCEFNDTEDCPNDKKDY